MLDIYEYQNWCEEEWDDSTTTNGEEKLHELPPMQRLQEERPKISQQAIGQKSGVMQIKTGSNSNKIKN